MKRKGQLVLFVFLVLFLVGMGTYLAIEMKKFLPDDWPGFVPDGDTLPPPRDDVIPSKTPTPTTTTTTATTTTKTTLATTQPTTTTQATTTTTTAAPTTTASTAFATTDAETTTAAATTATTTIQTTTTTEAATTTPAPTPFVCDNETIFIGVADVNKTDCSLYQQVARTVHLPSTLCTDYIVCEQGVPKIYRCPCGGVFHFASQQCLPHLSWFYVDPNDCTRYWRCEANANIVSWHHFTCQSNLAFNIWVPGPSPRCEARENVNDCLWTHPAVPSSSTVGHTELSIPPSTADYSALTLPVVNTDYSTVASQMTMSTEDNTVPTVSYASGVSPSVTLATIESLATTTVSIATGETMATITDATIITSPGETVATPDVPSVSVTVPPGNTIPLSEATTTGKPSDESTSTAPTLLTLLTTTVPFSNPAATTEPTGPEGSAGPVATESDGSTAQNTGTTAGISFAVTTESHTTASACKEPIFLGDIDASEVNCPRVVQSPVLFPASNCTTFTVCHPDGASLYRCPCDTLFHFATHQCLSHLSWFYTDPMDCSMYWRCVANSGLVSWHHFSCQPGLGFNTRVEGPSPRCEPRENVEDCAPGREINVEVTEFFQRVQNNV